MEVCVDSITSALNAEKGGASRVELCQCLSEGGLTPSVGLLRKAKELLSIPVFVLIRPRGGDFCYTPEEVEVMEDDISNAVENGSDGIVTGALSPSGDIDERVSQRLMERVEGIPMTFHRAFDWASDPFVALETVIELGFKRILTSGQSADAFEGLPLISDLVKQASGRIIVMPGAGINEDNLEKILRGSSAKEFHSSSSCYVRSPLRSSKLSQVQLGSSSSDLRWRQCDPDLVSRLLTIANRVWGSNH